MIPGSTGRAVGGILAAGKSLSNQMQLGPIPRIFLVEGCLQTQECQSTRNAAVLKKQQSACHAHSIAMLFHVLVDRIHVDVDQFLLFNRRVTCRYADLSHDSQGREVVCAKTGPMITQLANPVP